MLGIIFIDLLSLRGPINSGAKPKSLGYTVEVEKYLMYEVAESGSF